MHPIPTTTSTPIINIGIIQSTSQVQFSCDDAFTIEHIPGDTIREGTSDQPYQISINDSSPAHIIYQICAAVCKHGMNVEQRRDDLKARGFDPGERTVGMKLKIGDIELDNREVWLIVGEFSSRAQAERFLSNNDLPVDARVVEDIRTSANGTLLLNGKPYEGSLRIRPANPDGLITVANVPIGIEFHWQRTEELKYRGAIRIGFNNAGQLVVINEIDLENYLASVNSSEMTPDCPLALLEAQTVAARSTVLATMGKHHYNTEFHLCSDDHCQCYQGAMREQESSRQAVMNTYGEILMHGNEVCDARYSKICGGIMESYPNVWENIDIPYLVEGIDSDQSIEFPADTEDKARRLIDSDPDVFCNTNRHPLPPRLANLYSTKNLFRWEVTYSREQIEQFIHRKQGEDIGELIDIIPHSRGASGRIIYLDFVGSKKRLRIGKELEIRRVLSDSHLYSSCFYVIPEQSPSGALKSVTLKGAGWGHGVGLCQVGATVMALKGYSYPTILEHYFKQTTLKKMYSL